MSHWIAEICGPVIVATRNRRLTSSCPTLFLEVKWPLKKEQQALMEKILNEADLTLNGHLGAVLDQFNLGTEAIRTACAESLNVPRSERSTAEAARIESVGKEDASRRLDAERLADNLWDACRRIGRPDLDRLAQRIESTSTWEDLILPERQCQALREIGAHVRQKGKVYGQWGFATKSGRGLGITALFAGASGTGKTLAAEVLANDLKLDLYKIDLSSVVSKYIGETEKNLRRIFDAAEGGGVVLLFDEADALFGKRSEVKDSHDRHANIEVSYLLQRMESYRGLAILTTNMKESMDGAFLRRLRFILTFPFPDLEQREKIWRRVFPAATPTQGLDTSRLARLNVAGGNIRNIALNASFFAAEAGESVTMRHLLKATRREYIKLEKSLTDGETTGWT